MFLSFPLLDQQQLRRAREALAGGAWVDGRVTAGPQAAQVKNNQHLGDGEIARQLQGMIVTALDHSPTFLAAALPRKVFPPRINRYGGASNHFGRHVDNAIRFTDAGVTVRTDLSCTVFLSDPADYDGGELLIHESQGGRPVKLPAGHAVLYPGTTVHEVLPVTRGERLAAFFWIESMVRRQDQRQLLLDLDNTITDLRTREGESDTAVALTGTYHNLLRMWAQT